MMRHYRRTFLGIAFVFTALVASALLTNSAAANARERHSALHARTLAGRARCSSRQQQVAALQKAMEPVREFAAAWSPATAAGEKDAAEKIRSHIESIAQRQLGLVTDNAITPQPDRHPVHGVPVRVQRVTLRASGKDLAALLTWLGKVEESYPAALVEHCEFSSNVGGNTGLTIRLVQPLLQGAPRPQLAPTTLPDLAALPHAIASVPWRQYLPTRVKASGPIGFQRNPLQPAVSTDPRALPMLRDDRDEVGPRIESALDGHVRSVIRGATPLVVVDGRIFRIGDELVLGRTRERPVPDAKTKLKHIGDDRLILQVAGGTADRPILCDVPYMLPEFLKAR